MFLIKNVHDKESLIGLLSEFGPSSIVLVFSFINYYLKQEKGYHKLATLPPHTQKNKKKGYGIYSKESLF